MANWTDDLDIPMTPLRGRAQSAPQRVVDPLTTPLTPPRTAEMPGAGDPSGSDPGPPVSPIQEFTPLVPSRGFEVEVRALIVGRGVSFSGEISSCDRLVVEGTVQANIGGCDSLTIAQSGEFGGYASAQKVDVRGRFNGDLVALNRLLIRATGHVSGTVTYQEIEIESGGQISGKIHVLEHGGQTHDRNTRRRRRT